MADMAEVADMPDMADMADIADRAVWADRADRAYGRIILPTRLRGLTGLTNNCLYMANLKL